MRLSLEQLASVLYIALSCLVLVDGKGGGGGGRGGGGSLRGISRGGSKGLTKSRAALVVGSGAAGYAAYRAHKNSKKDREQNDGADIDSFDQYVNELNDYSDYKTQESTSYFASEGIGMSAWTLIALILGVIAVGTLGWYCCNVILPVWEDNRKMRRRSMLRRNPGMKDEVPLQETPSTATPSP